MVKEQQITPSFSWKARARSFLYAWAGLKALLRTEHNARLHLLATVVVTGASLVFPISSTEAVVLILATAGVWTAELINTAIEKLADHITPEWHPRIGTIKDLAAAAVLVSAAAALLAGAVIFIPKIINHVA